MRRYLHILGRPGALLPFALAFLARLPVSMAPLGTVLLIQSVRGTYALAGTVAAALTVGVAVGSPFWGARMDRIGQTRVLGPLSLASGVLLAALALGAVGTVSSGWLIVLALGVGLAFPPISPGMRAAWRRLLPDRSMWQAAYALEAVVIETMFVGGPLLLSALLLFAPPAVPLLVTAALLAVGGAGYALTGAARACGPLRSTAAGAVRGRSPLGHPAARSAMVVALLIAVGFGLSDVSLAATAESVLGGQERVGLLFLAIAGGSAIGGTVYGSRSWPGPERVRLPFTVAVFGVGLALVALLVGAGRVPLWLLLPLLFGVGLSVAPGLIVIANLVDAGAASDRLGEAQSWLSTAFTAGTSAGTALAGFLVDHGGPSWSLAGASIAVLIGALLATAAQPVWRGVDDTLADWSP